MNVNELPIKLFSLLDAYKRQAPDAPCQHSPCMACCQAQSAQVIAQAIKQQPLTFVLPAFPAKSPNPRKVLGIVPDEAENQALLFLQWLCDEIRKIYPPGARTVICSDGRVFGDCVGIPDPHVTQYQGVLARML